MARFLTLNPVADELASPAPRTPRARLVTAERVPVLDVAGLMSEQVAQVPIVIRALREQALEADEVEAMLAVETPPAVAEQAQARSSGRSSDGRDELPIGGTPAGPRGRRPAP